MKKNSALSCTIALAIIVLSGASQINAASVNHANWAKSGPGPGPWLSVGFVQAPSAKSGRGPGPWLALGSNF